MNDFHMITLANDFVATRRAEADRARLVRSARDHADAGKRSRRSVRTSRPGTSLAALLGRLASS